MRLLHGKITDEGWHEMVTVLGGDPNRPDWDGSPDLGESEGEEPDDDYEGLAGDYEDPSDDYDYEESVEDPSTEPPVEGLSNEEKRRLIRAQIRKGEWPGTRVDSFSMEEGEESVPEEENFNEP